MGPRNLLVVVALLTALAAAGSAAGGMTRLGTAVTHSGRTDAWPLHHGLTAAKSSRGPRVVTLQYLIRVPRPAENKLKLPGTLKPAAAHRGVYDDATAKAVVEYKFQAGFPSRGQCGAARDEWRRTTLTPWFFELLEGKRARPACWTRLVSVRARAARAATRTDRWPLHHGLTAATSSRGPRVSALQYLLRDPRPPQNVFAKVKGTLKPRTFTPGIDDAATAKAVVAYKFRIGYPAAGQCGSKLNQWRRGEVTPFFFALLRGDMQRTPCWVAVAAVRLKALEAGANDLALKIKGVELSQLGVYEPAAYYRYNYYFGLGYGLPWCAIFQNWSFVHGGYQKIGAPNPYFVPSIIDWARWHGYLNAKAKVGALVAFYGDMSHIGYVIKVMSAGYVSVEGNWANHVAEVYHPWNDHLRYFIWIPALTATPGQ